VLGISFDNPTDNKAFRDKFDFGFSLLSDEDRSVGETYDAVRAPDEQFADFPKRISYLINPEGVIAKTYEVADPAAHAEVVLADLTAIQG